MKCNPIGYLLVFLMTIAPTALIADLNLPENWEEMEIEAKWTSTRISFDKIIEDLSDDSSHFGYEMNVRWGGIPRKFIDHYYDTEQGELMESSHALRHRTRLTSAPRTDSRNLSTLLNCTWKKDWERIQYKSTPIRQGAIWFRKEVGDCKIYDEDSEDLCAGISSAYALEIITSPDIEHEALSMMIADHPSIDRSTLKPYLTVTDFRYRVEFRIDGEAILELSMDHLISENLVTGMIVRDYEVELELIADAPTAENLEELFRLSNLIEDKYELIPSSRSKGGNEIPDRST